MASTAHAPLKARVYLMLLALADEDLHGLGVARAVEALSDGAVRMWPAALYGTLEDLLGRGWIEEIADAGSRPANASDKQRFYRLTRPGARVLATETARLGSLVRIARTRLKPRTGGV